MARNTKNVKAYTLSLDHDLMDRLDKFCEKERRTRSSAVELAVERYLEEENFKKEGKNNG